MDDKERETLTAEHEDLILKLAGVQQQMEDLDDLRATLRRRLRHVTGALDEAAPDVAAQVEAMEATLGVKFAEIGAEALEKKKPPIIDAGTVDPDAFPDDRISAEVAAERAAAKEIPHG